MTEGGTHQPELKNTGYEIFIGILSILSIVNLVLLYTIQDSGLDTVLWVMNAILSAIFLIDFTYRLFTAESKTHYFFHMFGWADLLASLPVQQVKVLRVFASSRLPAPARLRRQEHRPQPPPGPRRQRTAHAAPHGHPRPRVRQPRDPPRRAEGRRGQHHHASDALWYTIVTISTVGYGDRYPVTNKGRIVGSLIIVIGVGIFGTFTGYLANLFLSPSKEAGRRATTTCRRPTARHRTAAGALAWQPGRHRRDNVLLQADQP